jgi:hypothetical protein
VGVYTSKSPQPPHPYPIRRKVGDDYFVVIADDYKIYLPLSVNEDAYLPPEFRGDLSKVSCKLMGDNLMRRDFPAVYVLQPFYIIRL